VKPRLIIALLITGVFVILAGVQENSSAETTNSVMARWPRQQPRSTASGSTQTQVPPGSRHAKGHPQDNRENGEKTIVVDVWSSVTSVADKANEGEPDKLSADFAFAALTAAFRMQSTERRLANSIRRGFPLGEFWIQTDLEGIDDSLRLAALSVSNDADRQALLQLENQNNRLQLWTGWLIDANRNLRLGDYYMSASALDNDERFQNSVACTKFLTSMLASRRSAADASCL